MAKFTGHTITSDSALGAAKIQRSLRFNSEDTAYLNRTPSSASNRKTWTWSSWVKRDQASAGTNRYMFMAGQTDGNDNVAHISFDNNDRFRFYGISGSFDFKIRTNNVYRDTTAWYHVMVAFDTTQATASNRAKLYVNGVQITDSLGQSDYPSQNHDSYFNNNVLHNIGRYNSGTTQWFEGYMAEINFIDGYAYDSSYFGFTDPQTGIWMPKRYEGAYGTNGFYLDFSDNSSTAALGIDKSPNGNDWTTNNFSVAAWPENDSVIDTPTNNFVILNDNDRNSNAPLANGGLQTAATATGGHYPVFTTKAIKSGKWYLEWKFRTNDSGLPSIMEAQHDSGSHNTDSTVGNNTSTVNKRGYGLLPGDGRTSSQSGYASYGSAISSSDTAQCAFDADTGKIYWGKNNTWFNSGNPETGANPAFSGIDMTKEWLFTWHVYGNANNVSVNFGSQGFTYTPPSGFKALCTENLSLNQTPSAIKPKKHFDVVTYTGNGSTGQSITSLEFQPDLIWFKSRSHARNNSFSDSVRGRAKVMFPDVTNAEDTDGDTQGVISYNPNGFTLGTPYNSSSMNSNGETSVAWCWKAGGNSNTYNIDGKGYATAAAAGLDGGTIDPTGSSINTEAGFSISTYTGNGTAGATVAHGLGKKPAWIIIKRRDAVDNWMVYHKQSNEGSSPEDFYLELNSTGSTNNSTIMLNDTAPTTTLITLGSDNSVNGNTATYVMYCWAEIPGFSKFGEYRARDADNSGPYIHTDFKPAWVMSKGLSLSWQDWSIFDYKRSNFGSNPRSGKLGANQSNAEVNDDYNRVDFLSDGWRVSGLSASDINYGSGYPKQLYMAFAEESTVTPFDTVPNAS